MTRQDHQTAFSSTLHAVREMEEPINRVLFFVLATLTSPTELRYPTTRVEDGRLFTANRKVDLPEAATALLIQEGPLEKGLGIDLVAGPNATILDAACSRVGVSSASELWIRGVHHVASANSRYTIPILEYAGIRTTTGLEGIAEVPSLMDGFIRAAGFHWQSPSTATAA